jgi:hypothetical protein
MNDLLAAREGHVFHGSGIFILALFPKFDLEIFTVLGNLHASSVVRDV